MTPSGRSAADPGSTPPAIHLSGAGFYGKLPSLGDFITRRLPGHFIQPWDLWLRGSLGASRTQLAQDWLDHYLTSPLWRFVLSPGITGQTGWAGVLMPSVDRVGRYFPLTLAVPLEPGDSPFRSLCASDWYERAEAIALSGLSDDFDLEAFDAQVLGLGAPGIESLGRGPIGAEDQALSPDAWRLEVQSPAHLRDACPTLLDRTLEELFFAYSLWGTGGSERVAPSLLACQGLPAPEGFAALLVGGWSGYGWLELSPR